MRRIIIALAISLWSRTAFASNAATYFEFSLNQYRYFDGVPPGTERENYTVLGADLNLETQSSGFNYKFNSIFQGALETKDEFYAGVPEFYLQPRKLAPNFDLTIGRQKRLWSHLDEEFNLGIWQPQLRWDFLAPTQEGLTGIFFDWSLSSAVHFSFFTSPLYIPDQGPNYHLRDGEFSSSNRWFVPPQNSLSLFQNTPYASDAPLYFRVDKPSNQDVFMHSSFGFSVNYLPGGPFWSQVSYAYKPINQIHLAIECANCANIGSGPPLEVTAVIHPKVVSHNVLTWEGGFDSVDDRGWISLTGDFPQRSGNPSEWAEAQLSNMLVTGFAYQHYVGPWIGVPSWLQFAYLKTFEFRRRSESGLVPEEDVRSSFDRYPYRELAVVDWKLLIQQTKTNRVYWRNRYSFSPPDNGGWLASIFEWARGPITYSLGTDILGSSVEPESAKAGLFTRYRSNDRVYGGVSYVF